MKPKYQAVAALFLIAATVSAVDYQITHNRPGQVLGITSQNTALPLGDNKVSSSPQAGYIFSCQQQFNSQGGAGTDGHWISGSLWYPSSKVAVSGSVKWKTASYKSSLSSTTRTITANGLPTNSTTGTFPIKSTDPAYQYDRNPNSIKAQSYSLKLPANPKIAATFSCVTMGMIGIATNGVAIFNGLDAEGRDAVAHEVQDFCGGHPQQNGVYHYHGPSTCLPNVKKKNALVGYALDGFGIYSMYDANGKEYTNAELDECHGLVSTITWNNKKVKMYHYVLTREYPYTIGCFKGTPIQTAQSGNQQGARPGQGQNPSHQPPQVAIDACSGKAAGDSCQFTGMMNDTITGTCKTLDSELICVPQMPPQQ